MKKRTFLLSLMCLMAMSTAWAESISETQARSIAESFMASHYKPNSHMTMAKKGPNMQAPASSEQAAYYVFNNSQAHGGYVIVAGDNRAPAVLGYSVDGTFDANNVPVALQELLDGYTAQINALSMGGQPVRLNPSGSAIRPLVTANWAQEAPFNIMLPMVYSNMQAVTGCVATAMAQTMYYWKYPECPTATIPAYTSASLGIYMPALEPVNFNWDAMQDVYMESDTESDGAVAAAQLNLYCAQSVQMNFLYGASSASTAMIATALSTYFGYKASAHCEYRENFTTQGWSDLLYNELAEGRPVVYSGSKASGGHAFICDGYDGEGMFHINWGWNGMSNGYFLLNVLNPDAQGTGSASEPYGYIYSQYVIVGIEPGEGESQFAMTASNVQLNGANTTRTSTSANFSATVTGRFCNYTNQTIDVSFGWGFYQGDELLNVLYNTSISELPPNYFVNLDNRTVNFGRNITSGTYRIVPIYSERGANNWRPCIGSDVNYIEVTIEDNNCTVIGQGSAGERDYVINSITYSGTAHHGRPVNLAVNMTNNGYSQNDMLYMFVNGNFNSTAYLGLEHGETDDIAFSFVPQAPGTYTLSFSFNQDGSDPIATTTINIDAMPDFELDGYTEMLNVTDSYNYIVTSDKYSFKLYVTNYSDVAYLEDLTVMLYRNTNGNYGNNVQVMDKQVTIAPNQEVEVQFDLDNVIDGCRYFAAICYYSGGEQYVLTTTPYYTIVFPDEPAPEPMLGDVNGDDEVNITDVILYINYLLNDEADGFVIENADFNQDGATNISDVIDMINFLLNDA